MKARVTAASASLVISMKVDNEFRLFVGGKMIPQQPGQDWRWNRFYDFTLPVEAGDVIAIEALDHGGLAGFVGTVAGVATVPAGWQCLPAACDGDKFEPSATTCTTPQGIHTLSESKQV